MRDERWRWRFPPEPTSIRVLEPTEGASRAKTPATVDFVPAHDGREWRFRMLNVALLVVVLGVVLFVGLAIGMSQRPIQTWQRCSRCGTMPEALPTVIPEPPRNTTQGAPNDGAGPQSGE